MTSERVRPDANRERTYGGAYMDQGKDSEEVVMAFLRERPYILEIDDYRELRPMRKADVDCGIETVDGRITLAEIKRDWHMGVSGNVLFEMARVNHTAPPERAVTLGWSARSPATYLLIHAPQKEAIYQCRFDELRRVFQGYSRRQRQQVRTDWICTDNIKSTLCAFVPYSECEGIFERHPLVPGEVLF